MSDAVVLSMISATVTVLLALIAATKNRSRAGDIQAAEDAASALAHASVPIATREALTAQPQ